MSTADRRLSGSEATARPATAGVPDEEALDAEFLEYLEALEGEQEDWTWFSEHDAANSADEAAATEEAHR